MQFHHGAGGNPASLHPYLHNSPALLSICTPPRQRRFCASPAGAAKAGFGPHQSAVMPTGCSPWQALHWRVVLQPRRKQEGCQLAHISRDLRMLYCLSDACQFVTYMAWKPQIITKDFLCYTGLQMLCRLPASAQCGAFGCNSHAGLQDHVAKMGTGAAGPAL